jgi:hypothetical protein
MDEIESDDSVGMVRLSSVLMKNRAQRFVEHRVIYMLAMAFLK